MSFKVSLYLFLGYVCDFGIFFIVMLVFENQIVSFLMKVCMLVSLKVCYRLYVCLFVYVFQGQVMSNLERHRHTLKIRHKLTFKVGYKKPCRTKQNNYYNSYMLATQ